MRNWSSRSILSWPKSNEGLQNDMTLLFVISLWLLIRSNDMRTSSSKTQLQDTTHPNHQLQIIRMKHACPAKPGEYASQKNIDPRLGNPSARHIEEYQVNSLETRLPLLPTYPQNGE